MENNLCKICGAALSWKDGGTRKDGTTYDGFMACPNYKNHPKKGQPQFQKAVDSSAIILDEIQEVNKRLDKLIAFCVEKLK